MNNLDRDISVLFISRKWPPAIGGMETYSVELTTELARFVKLRRYVLPGRSNGYPPTAMQSLRFLVRSALFIARHRSRYDIVHFGDLTLFPLAWLHSKLAPSRKRIMALHGLDLIYGNRQGNLPALYRRFIQFAKNRANAVNLYIANSQNTARIATDYGFTPTCAVPLGVRQPPAPAPPSLPAKPVYLLFVGRLVPRKGAAWFATEVMPLLNPTIHLVVVGKPWNRREVDLLNHAERTELRGYVADDELRELRRQSLAVVMPNQPSRDNTDIEGFGLTALEAPCDGVPIIASSIEGVTDAVSDGETGFLLPHNDPAAWSLKIREISGWTQDTRRAFAQRAQKAIAKHYSWERVAADTVRCYRETMGS